MTSSQSDPVAEIPQMTLERRRLLLGLAGASTCLAIPKALAADRRFFRIGTGGITGTYYPIGGLVAEIVSNPPGSRPCDADQNCGVPGLVALAQTSSGSVENIESIASRYIESGFAQSDVAYGAFSGSGIFSDRDPSSSLRAITNLYPESMHLLATRESGITNVRQLRNKRVSVDEVGSGTLVDAKILLDAHDMTLDDLDAVHVKPAQAITMMQNGELDALFLIAGYPAISILELIETADVQLLAINGPEINKLIQKHHFFTVGEIPLQAYGTQDPIPTLNVSALWLTSLEQDEDLIYQITKALWSDHARQKLDSGHPKGREILLETALNGVAVPLHPGAAKFYKSKGMIVH